MPLCTVMHYILVISYRYIIIQAFLNILLQNCTLKKNLQTPCFKLYELPVDADTNALFCYYSKILNCIVPGLYFTNRTYLEILGCMTLNDVQFHCKFGKICRVRKFLSAFLNTFLLITHL